MSSIRNDWHYALVTSPPRRPQRSVKRRDNQFEDALAGQAAVSHWREEPAPCPAHRDCQAARPLGGIASSLDSRLLGLRPPSVANRATSSHLD